MFAEGFAVFVEELGIGSFQRPSELCRVAFARVDLIALGMDLEQELFRGVRLELLRDLLRWKGKRKDQAHDGESRGECWAVNSNAHGSIPPVGRQLTFGAGHNSTGL